MFAEKRGQDPITETFRYAQHDDPDFEQGLVSNLRKEGLSPQEIDSIIYGRQAVEEQDGEYVENPKIERALETRIEGTTTWKIWLAERIKLEALAMSTKRQWEGALRCFSEWYGSDT